MSQHSKAIMLLVLLLGLTGTSEAQDKPNIVLVFMDNFGWGEPGFNGRGIVRGAPTPRLDKLASEGLRLTNFNVEVQCTKWRKPIRFPATHWLARATMGINRRQSRLDVPLVAMLADNHWCLPARAFSFPQIALRPIPAHPHSINHTHELISNRHTLRSQECRNTDCVARTELGQLLRPTTKNLILRGERHAIPWQASLGAETPPSAMGSK